MHKHYYALQDDAKGTLHMVVVAVLYITSLFVIGQ